jgi:peptidoglycan-binding protein ArfA
VNFPASRISTFAHGQSNPVAPNATEDGRAKNRRVEIVLSIN